MEDIPHMVEQVIKYSDGTETVINYRGRIVDGELIPDEPKKNKKIKTKTEKSNLKGNV